MSRNLVHCAACALVQSSHQAAPRPHTLDEYRKGIEAHDHEDGERKGPFQPPLAWNIEKESFTVSTAGDDHLAPWLLAHRLGTVAMFA